MLRKDNTRIYESELLETLNKAMAKAYAPYSNYSVGALVVAEDGSTFTGCNVENASYPEGHCAETAAIAAMVMAGYQKITKIYVVSGDKKGAIPCGGCRQRIREFASQQTPVILCSPQGVVNRLVLNDLLPKAFGPEYIDKRS